MKKPTLKQQFHASRIFLFLMLGAALLVSSSDGNIGNSLSATYNKQVLAYATNMNSSDLLAAANASRAANGLTPLKINSLLNNSAQMKAADMIADDYWAHTSPDGIEPWYWFKLAGYDYATAGENLAYGFNTGYEVSTAWMNSPTHRANILGDYTEVGFGIANGVSFQGDNNTVVVAHYGRPRVVVAAPTTPTPAPALTSTPTQAPATAPAPTTTTPVDPTPAEPSPTDDPEVVTPTDKDTPAPTQNEMETPSMSVQVSESSKKVSVFDQIRNGKASTYAIMGIGIASAASAGFALTHRKFMRKMAEKGQRFFVRHTLLDVTILCLVLGFILMTTAGKLL